MTEIAIIGIGNPFRGDDGAGWAVIDAIEENLDGKIPLYRLRGDLTELLETFANHSTLYLIDACQMDAEPGSWQKIDALKTPLLLDNLQTSTHDFSISQAIALAKNLDQLPTKLIIYAINGNQYQMSNSLSPPVAASIDALAQTLLDEKDIQSCMKKA